MILLQAGFFETAEAAQEWIDAGESDPIANRRYRVIPVDRGRLNEWSSRKYLRYAVQR
jgi:hypothetical protein